MPDTLQMLYHLVTQQLTNQLTFEINIIINLTLQMSILGPREDELLASVYKARVETCARVKSLFSLHRTGLQLSGDGQFPHARVS